MQLKTKGIVLKQRNIGENDRIITILTEEHSIIEASARRVKAARNGITAACELFTYSEFCLFKSKSGYIVNSAETVNSFYSLRLDVKKLALAGYFCELVAYLSPASEHARDYIKMLLNSFYFLQENKRSEAQLKSIFEFRSVCLAGFMPNLVCCAECSEFEYELMYFFPLDGIIICSKCLANSGYDKASAIKQKLYPSVLAALRHIAFADPERVFSFKLETEGQRQLSFITESYVLLHTEGKFKSLEVYKSLNESDA